jgi:dihydrodipicolinate synthase/N-acetylneuraminate lyase
MSEQPLVHASDPNSAQSGAGFPLPPVWVQEALRRGLVIPAHPLALTPTGRFDERRQRALTRYYHAAGAGGMAVGVHTTQFAIRDPEIGLYQPVLELAAESLTACDQASGRKTVRIAGLSGSTKQAAAEAAIARDLGYHAGLLSLAALREASIAALLDHARAVAGILPLIGFYLQPAVGGRLLPENFWRDFAGIPNVIGIKAAPFNRYQTLDVLRGVAASGRAHDIALYTGNDDNILLDLLMTCAFQSGEGPVELGFTGGLLGHWACWTRRAVEHLTQCKAWREEGQIPAAAMCLAQQITDANAAFFDAANGFAGCIAGIHEVLRRQGLLESIRCLDEMETLSPGQKEAIDHVYRLYPHLNDDAFVAEHRDAWLS